MKTSNKLLFIYSNFSMEYLTNLWNNQPNILIGGNNNIAFGISA